MRWLMAVALIMAGLAGCVGGDGTGPEPTGQADGDARIGSSHATANITALRADVEAAIDADEPVVLPFTPIDHPTKGPTAHAEHREEPIAMAVRLDQGALLRNDTWFEVDGAPVDHPQVRVYEGYAVEHPTWPVRLAIAGDWARGYVHGEEQIAPGGQPAPRAYHLRFNLDGNLPPGAYNETESHTGHKRAATAAPARTDARECPVVVPGGYSLADVMPITPVATRPPDLDPVTVDIILDMDGQAYDLAGEHAFPLMVAMLQGADAIYEHELGIRFQIVGLHAHTTHFTASADQHGFNMSVLADARAYWNHRDDVDRDLVHVFSGMDGARGVAYCVGSAGIPELAYATSPLRSELIHIDRGTRLIAHEIGHTFNAQHEYGNLVQGGEPGQGTMMYGYDRPVFGSLSKAIVRGWADEFVGNGALVALPPGADAARDAPWLDGQGGST